MARALNCVRWPGCGAAAPPPPRSADVFPKHLLVLERPADRVFRVEFCLRALLLVPLLLPQLRPFPVTVCSSALPLCANLAQDRQANIDAAVAGASLMFGSSGSGGSSVAEQSAPRPSRNSLLWPRRPFSATEWHV